MKKKKEIEDQGKALKPEENGELETIEGLFPRKIRNIEIKNKLDEIKEWEEKIKRKDFIYKTNKYKDDFRQYETIRSFGESIYAGKILTNEAEVNQSSLLKNIVNEKSRPRTKEGKNKKEILLRVHESAYAFYEGQELTLNPKKAGVGEGGGHQFDPRIF